MSDTSVIAVVVCGAAGRMGREIVRAISRADDMRLVGAVDLHAVGEDAGAAAGVGPMGVTVSADLDAVLESARAEVLVDFTGSAGVMANLRTAIAHGVSLVIGTTGLTDDDRNEIDRLARERGVGALYAPNFSIGAVLMMQFAAQAAAMLPDAEIIEFHHEKKLDSPSGTALLTATRIAEAREKAGARPIPSPSDAVEKVPHARGARAADVPIHSVRLPGFVAHQEVIFGGTGEILTIRHDSTDRKCFMPGVLLAVRKVRSLRGLVIGLEYVL